MSPVIPGSVTFALLLVLEVSAVLVWYFFFVRKRQAAPGALLLCTHCIRLHARAETIARVADALAVGALAFLVALAFVAAGYEGGFTVAGVLLCVATVLGVLALGAELDFFVRATAARFLPQFAWKVDPARLVGGGARWLGIILAVYLFQRPDLPGRGLAGLFGGVGERLANDLQSTAAIYTAAALLLAAAIAALAARWLVPFALNSLPLTLATRRESQGRST